MYNNVLRYPLSVVYKIAIAAIELNVSVKRLESYLMESEVERLQTGRSHFEPTSPTSISLQPETQQLGFKDRASFDYGGQMKQQDHEMGLATESTPLLRVGGSGSESHGGDTAIIKDLDFCFPESNGMTIIVGPTGCGKSTMLLALLGGWCL
jgi:ABC-type multidrug transport system fused ATPase/permease subunit